MSSNQLFFAVVYGIVVIVGFFVFFSDKEWRAETTPFQKVIISTILLTPCFNILLLAFVLSAYFVDKMIHGFMKAEER